MADEPLIPVHGGYRNLKTFQLAQLCHDLTVRFCDGYVHRRSRTHDQMVQAARSGVQNIAEGSQASGTSKKTELRLTNVARASLEELRLDYEDFLRHRGLGLWAKEDPAPGILGGPALRHGGRRGRVGQRATWTEWTGWTGWTVQSVHKVHTVHLFRNRRECGAGPHCGGLCAPRPPGPISGGGF
jgi:four helix bundle protein